MIDSTHVLQDEMQPPARPEPTSSIVSEEDQPDYHTQRELFRILEECATDDWNNADAVAIPSAAVSEVIELIAALPANLARPDVGPDTDGTIGLHWGFGTPQEVVVALPGDGTMEVSYVVRGNSGHESRPLAGPLSDLISRVRECVQDAR